MSDRLQLSKAQDPDDEGSPDNVAAELEALAILNAVAHRTRAAGGSVEPSPSLRDRVLSAARAERFQSMLAHRGLWIPVPDVPGAKQKVLYAPGAEGVRTSLVRAPAAAELSLIETAADPAIVVIDGALAVDDATYDVGDYVESTDSRGARVTATADCMLLMIERGGVRGPSPVGRKRTVRRGDGTWRQLGGGTRIKPLAGGVAEPVDVLLLEMDPGAVLPEHHHSGLEEIFLLRGDCVAQGQSLSVGDYHRAYEGTDHQETTTAGGCLMVVIVRRAA